MGTGDDFPGGKAAGAIPPLPKIYSWHSADLIKHRDNFTVPLPYQPFDAVWSELLAALIKNVAQSV
jgi:hypothetical protein